jgi:hypothetical protein
MMEDFGIIRRSSYWASEQVLDFPLQDGVGLETKGVEITFFLQYSIQRWNGKGRIATKELLDVEVTIPIDYRQEYPSPELRAGVIAA